MAHGLTQARFELCLMLLTLILILPQRSFAIGKAHAFFRRLRISVRGQIIEDIDNYNRVSEMFHILQTRHSRMNDMIEEFGYNGDIWALDDAAKLPGIGTTEPGSRMS